MASQSLVFDRVRPLLHEPIGGVVYVILEVFGIASARPICLDGVGRHRAVDAGNMLDVSRMLAGKPRGVGGLRLCDVGLGDPRNIDLREVSERAGADGGSKL